MCKKRILLLYDNNELDRQVLQPTDYFEFEESWKKQHGGNAGNKLFISAVEQYLTKIDIEYQYYTGDESIEEINDVFHMIVLPLANIFNINRGVIEQLNYYTALIEQFKIPVYILGCGIQCNSYDEINELVRILKRPVEGFLRAIYKSGGELALRGYATKEFLDKILPNTSVVTGCPSMYQCGDKLKITNEKVKEDIFYPAINGNLKYLKKIGLLSAFDKYKNSIYMDQDEFSEWLYFRKINESIFKLIRTKTFCSVKLLSQNRVKLIYDVPVWIAYMKKENFNFSCGTRIHGNIAATLAGIPAEVICKDARTRELAEFFELPHRMKINKGESLYEMYLETDYSKFNESFKYKFENFEHFLVSHGISYDINDNTLFKQKQNEKQWNMPKEINKRF